MSTGGDTPQPATAPTASAVDAPNLAVSGTSGGTLDPGVLEALRAAVRQEVRAALAPAPSSSNPPTGTPAAPGTASGKNSARGSSDTYVRGKALLRDGRAKQAGHQRPRVPRRRQRRSPRGLHPAVCKLGRCRPKETPPAAVVPGATARCNPGLPHPGLGASRCEPTNQSYHPLGGLIPLQVQQQHLGVIPLPASLAGLPLFSISHSAISGAAAAAKAASGTTVTTSLASPLSASLVPSVKPPGQGAVVLSSVLPPIGAKLSQKIRSQQYVTMKELLTDNMALHRGPASTGGCHSTPSPPAGDRLSLDMGLLLSGLCGGPD